jgi:lipoyl(octanoyl) transferase 2
MINLCAEFGVKGFRTKDTGVWCSTAQGDRKIASIGVHLRRNITSHGVGINVTDEVMPYFDRIDACGLGKGVTTFESMGVQTTREDVEKKWVSLLSKEVGADIQMLTEVAELEQIWGLNYREVLDAMLKGESEGQYEPEGM